MKWPFLSVGSTGPEVGNWQRFLNTQGVRDWENRSLEVDERYGRRTAFATSTWQTQEKLVPSAALDDATRARAEPLGFIPFIQARNFRAFYPQKRPVTLIVIHTMEAPEKPGTALNVAKWFAGLSAPMASAHYCVGQDAIYQCVRDDDIAFHAPGANLLGIGVEHEGYARQKPEEWDDPPSRATLSRSAALVARLCAKYNIPVRRLTGEELKAGKRGVIGHVDATLTFKSGSHWDPGPGFPWDDYLEMVESAR